MTIFKRIAILALFGLGWSCSGEQNATTEAQTNDSTAQETTPVSTPVQDGLPAELLSADVERSLKAQLGEASMAYINQLRTLFRNASTAQQMAEVYFMADSVRGMFRTATAPKSDGEYPDPPTVEKEWAWLEQAVPFMRVRQLCSECGAELYLNLLAMSAKAQQTPETSDDLFFESLQAAYQPSYEDPDLQIFLPDGPTVSTVRLDGCDLCGYHRLGDGATTTILQKIERAKAASPLFAKPLTELMEEAVPNDYFTHFGSNKTEVAKELEAILQGIQLLPAQKLRLENLKAKLNTQKDLQFGCKKPGKCQYNV